MVGVGLWVGLGVGLGLADALLFADGFEVACPDVRWAGLAVGEALGEAFGDCDAFGPDAPADGDEAGFGVGHTRASSCSRETMSRASVMSSAPIPVRTCSARYAGSDSSGTPVSSATECIRTPGTCA
jgi:hypothetical protein